jgi:hypothetical protein
MSSVAVPKAYPLFNLENDDPLDIPGVVGFEWVAKAYNRAGREDRELENEMARLLLRQARVKDGRWVGLRSWWKDPAISSILVVQRQKGEVKGEIIKGICKLIKDVVVPLMTEEWALQPGIREEIIRSLPIIFLFSP